MNTCPHCQAQDQTVKAGSQRHHYKRCRRTYTPEPKASGYEETMRQQAVRPVADGMNYRRAARQLGVNHRSVINWVNAAVAQLPGAPLPNQVAVIEMEELYTFVQRKNEVYVMTLVERDTSCTVGWEAAFSQTEAPLQALVDAAPQARFSYSDLLAVYRSLLYTPGIHTPMPNKSETFRVEDNNAELRHYLARLARRSRCFSCCIHALRRAIHLFVYLWNTHQLSRQRFPSSSH